MKHLKTRIYRVVVVGATPAGVAATQKLEEMNIPVTLVESDSDLDHKLSDERWNLKSGIPFNFVHRGPLLRISSNSGVNAILPAKVLSIKHNSQGFAVKIKKRLTFVDLSRCTLCGRCVEACPVTLEDGGKAVNFNSSLSLPGRPVIDKRMEPYCQTNCPLGVNAQGYIALSRVKKFKEALELVRKDNILPGICGRICTHKCEEACRRNEIDEPIAIRDIKRFLADYELSHQRDGNEGAIKNAEQNAAKVAVIGSGPAGLAAAADLARAGLKVTVFEKEKLPGGLLRYGIGKHRLPREILNFEIDYIKKLGVDFCTSSIVDLDENFDNLKKDFDAVILSTGVWTDQKLGVPGEDLKNVYGCISFLKKIYSGEITKLNKKVAVIGDGNAAFDLARTLIRIGADVTILSWFSKDSIPADFEEVKGAMDEGVTIKDSIKVTRFLGNNGILKRLVSIPTKPGKPDASGVAWPVMAKDKEPVEFDFDMAFVAIGQKSSLLKNFKGYFNLSQDGFILTDESHRTNLPGVYAAGDVSSGPSSVVDAMASGRAAARGIIGDICKKNLNLNLHTYRPGDVEFLKIPEDLPSRTRPAISERQPGVRKDNFSEVCMGLSESQVLLEASRCLQCGACSECMECVKACGDIKAINHGQVGSEITEVCGVVIIADQGLAPTVRGDDVIRAYGPKAARPDVYAEIMRGYAAAAEAMLLLPEISQRPKGCGLSFSPPDAGLPPEIRIAVFACRCNNSFGWLDKMTQHVEGLISRENVVSAEVINSACISEGYSHIIRSVREKGITRLVLASCVCCPLNFTCSSCTFQRNRLKEALFTGTGISRSMVETCNLRGESLSLLKHDSELAMERFTGLIDRSIKRAAMLKTLPSPVRPYNFTTAVIGDSEAAIFSALTLAKAGVEVFIFPILNNGLTEFPNHPNIQIFEDYAITRLSGCLGDFQISVEKGEFKQVIQAGAIILGEKSRKKIPFIINEKLPSRPMHAFMQNEGTPGIPFFYPGSTSIAGLFLSDPPGVNISNRKKGAAAAVQAAAIMPLGPRQSKGFVVVVNKDLCRGCGRCIRVCPYQAITLSPNSIHGWCASVDEATCKGCGNCISVCPSNAADSPYRNQGFLEQSLEELLEE
ncbi:MAG TPA: 4Fe-4S ferredoxin [Desulfobacteraceae bacterium]|nr:4Fe-4S ferredoxin [Desulfobacteraceae bacterium]